MIAIAFVVGGLLLIAALIGVVYMASQRNREDETGRRTEGAPPRSTPRRTEGRET